MSRILMCFCLTMGLIIAGCGDANDKGSAKDNKTESKTSDKDEKGSAAKGSTTKSGEKQKADDKKEAPANAEKKDDKKADAGKASATQLVSVKLPNMT
jgi:hypothetical protein